MLKKEKLVRRMACAASLCLLLAVLGTVASAQNADRPRLAAASSESPVSITELPDSPGATYARLQTPTVLQADLQQGASSASDASAQQTQQQTDQPRSQSSQPDQQASPQRPVGTAAAEPTHASGIAASQPAGVAIAPVKQRRTRTIVIRVGALIGAGVAVGTVAALTMGTSSRPPGAH